MEHFMSHGVVEFFTLEGLVYRDELPSMGIHPIAIIIPQISQPNSDPNPTDSYAFGEAHPSA
jgi:hypothetical protein